MRKFLNSLEQKLKSLGVSSDELGRIEAESDEYLQRSGLKKYSDERLDEQAKMGLFSDLKQVGIDVDDVWKLVCTKESYPEAIPVLMKHLKLPYKQSFNRNGIARALAVPEAKIYWRELLAEYKEAEGGVKDGLACALAVIAKATKRYSEILDLLRDETLDDSRIFFLSVISSARDPKISAHLEEFADHPLLGIQTRIILKRRNKRKKT